MFRIIWNNNSQSGYPCNVFKLINQQVSCLWYKHFCVSGLEPKNCETYFIFLCFWFILPIFSTPRSLFHLTAFPMTPLHCTRYLRLKSYLGVHFPHTNVLFISKSIEKVLRKIWNVMHSTSLYIQAYWPPIHILLCTRDF